MGNGDGIVLSGAQTAPPPGGGFAGGIMGNGQSSFIPPNTLPWIIGEGPDDTGLIGPEWWKNIWRGAAGLPAEDPSLEVTGPPAPSGWTVRRGKLCLIGQPRTIVPCYRARMIATPAGPMLVRARRRMNPLNFSAAKRASRRISSLAKICRSVVSMSKRVKIKKRRRR